MQKERSNTPFFISCLYAALISIVIGIGILLLLCALCFVTDDPASSAGYGANIALLLSSLFAGYLSAKSNKQAESIAMPILGSLTAGGIVFCLLLGLSLLIPSGQSERLIHLLTTLPIYALCVLGMSIVGGLITVNRRPKKRSARVTKRAHAPKGVRRKY